MWSWYCTKEASAYSLGKEKYSLYDLLHHYAYSVYNYYFHRRNNYYCWILSINGRAQGMFELNRIGEQDKYTFHNVVSYKQQGKGFSTEAVNVICDYMATQNCEAVYITVDSENIASVKVAEKCSFAFINKKEAYFRYPSGKVGDCLIYKRQIRIN